MGMKCSGCEAKLDASFFMECSQERCKKKFHPKCLALTEEKVEAFTQEYKDKWICPECVCAMPKSGNTNTPVRGTTSISKTVSPNSWVNTGNRDSRRNTAEIMVNTEIQLLDEIREFRWEVKKQLEEQRNEYILLQNRFINTETELKEVKQILKVVQEKANKVEMLETRIKVLIGENEKLEASLKKSQVPNQVEQGSKDLALSFSTVVKDKQVVKNNVARECVATKSAAILVNKEQTHVISEKKSKNIVSVEKEQPEKEAKWTTVTRKKNRFSTSDVKKGGNTSDGIDIQGTEKKKYLHVWRLQKDTTVESVEKHVKKIYVEEVPIKVEQIKHKTERDYASFIIGVPASKYEKLCQPESWAVNIEFAEWVWFRRATIPRYPI